MSTVPEIKLRLLEAGTPFNAVLGATALAKVKGRPEGVQLPVAYVLAAREVSADNSRTIGKVLQRQERDIMVVYVCEDVSDGTGDASTDELEAIKAWARGKLIGFVPTDMNSKITHVGGEVVEAVNACVWFEDTFSAPTYIEEVTP